MTCNKNEITKKTVEHASNRNRKINRLEIDIMDHRVLFNKIFAQIKINPKPSLKIEKLENEEDKTQNIKKMEMMVQTFFGTPKPEFSSSRIVKVNVI